MAFSKGYRDFVVEQLERIAPVTAKSMFGGVGLYAQGLFFALIAEDRLYFKVDDTTRPDFERLGMEPFRPYGEENAMGYYEVPADVLEDVAQLEPWMRKAIDVAAKATQGEPKPPSPAGRGGTGPSASFLGRSSIAADTLPPSGLASGPVALPPQSEVIFAQILSHAESRKDADSHSELSERPGT